VAESVDLAEIEETNLFEPGERRDLSSYSFGN
jgi:hypothetical protein